MTSDKIISFLRASVYASAAVSIMVGLTSGASAEQKKIGTLFKLYYPDKWTPAQSSLLRSESLQWVDVFGPYNLHPADFLPIGANVKAVKVNFATFDGASVDDPRFPDLYCFTNAADARELEFSNIEFQSLTGASEFTQLESLRITTSVSCLARIDCLRIHDVSPLSELHSLKELHLIGQDIEDISYLGMLPSLEVLSLQANEVCDLRPISNTGALRKLDVRGCPNLTVSELNKLFGNDVEILFDHSESWMR